jgi:hypothetical protein
VRQLRKMPNCERHPYQRRGDSPLIPSEN